jgi:hypothetical protein
MFQRRKCRGANVTRRNCRRRNCQRRNCHQAQVSRGANVGGANVEAQVSEAQKGRRKCRIILFSEDPYHYLQGVVHARVPRPNHLSLSRKLVKFLTQEGAIRVSEESSRSRKDNLCLVLLSQLFMNPWRSDAHERLERFQMVFSFMVHSEIKPTPKT